MRVVSRNFHQRWRYVVSVTVLLFALSFVIAQLLAAPIGQGSYTTTLPGGAAGPSDFNGNPAWPKVTNDFDKTILTNQWWSSLIWQYFPDNPYSDNLYAHPIAARAASDGLGIGYPTYVALNNEYHANYLEDMRVGLVGLNSPDTRVADYSDWTVTARWEGGGRLDATLGHGLPFVYFTTGGGTARIDIPTGFEGTWHNQNGVLGVSVNGHHYGIFGPAGSNWGGSPPFQNNLNGQNYFSVAVLPDNNPATLEFYRQHAYAFITDTQVDWSYDEATANLRTSYTATSELKEGGNGNVNQPLMAMYRHQWINSSTPTTAYTYFSPRGDMKVVDGASFVTDMRFNGVLPGLPDEGTYDRNQLWAYVNDVYNEVVANPIQPSDTYWGGKAVGRLAALVPIAEQVGHTQARDEFISQMKRLTEDWLNANDGQPSLIYYNDVWDTAIGYPASFQADTQLNDHHFHWGYWIMAAATIARYDPAWASQDQWGGMIDFIIRDASSMDRHDPMFPFLRFFDIYAGHGWASGPALFAAGNNQESSSEGMNYATAVILWGSETGNTALRDLGIYMYANTVQAIEQYWFDVDGQVFPQDYDYEAVGMVWGNGGAYATWWTANVEEIHGINFLPFTGGSLYLGRNPSYVTRNYDHMVWRNGGQETEWVDIMWQYQALADPSAALAKFGSGNYSPEGGESKAHTYHWLHNLNALGHLDSDVTSDIPTYAVFNNGGTRTYVAYNPHATNVSVAFSDGRCLDVAPGQIASGPGYFSSECGIDIPVTPTATNEPGGNLALNRPAVSSSNEDDSLIANNAVDGSTGSRWSSAFSDPQWIYVDLGQSYNIQRVVLNWETAFGAAYEIQVSNNASSWQTIYTETNGDGGVDELNVNGNGRYVRVYGTQRGTEWGYSLWELEVYGAGDVTQTPTATPVPPTSTPTATPVPPTNTPTATPTNEPNSNLALNRPSVSSSVENADLSANNAVDGSIGSRWSSAFSDPQWIYVDLGQSYNIQRVVLNWEAAYGAAYEIQVSNDANNWETIYTESNGDGGIDEMNVAGNGRYVRMVGLSRGTPYGYSLWEMEVYGSEAGGETFSGSGSGGSYHGDISYNGSLVTIRVQSDPNASNILIFPSTGGGYFMTYDSASDMFVHQISGMSVGDDISFHIVIQNPTQWEPGITHNWIVSH